MRPLPGAATVVVLALLAPAEASSQGLVVDQGRFVVSIRGDSIGVEDFTIRRAGLGREDAIFANASVALSRDGARQEIRPLLRATPPDGIAIEYQVEVTGIDAMELGLRRTGRRFVATIQSELGEEQREFAARPETRVLEIDVAHHYYFLRDTSEGTVTPVLVPRTREHVEVVTGASSEEDIRIGTTITAARRVEFSTPSDSRIVWFDRLGRVLRVEVPANGYAAERSGVLRCRRGHIAVLDRSGLEAGACECYAVVKKELGRLLSDVRYRQTMSAVAA